MSNAIEMNVEQGVRLLLTQLVWPSGLIRERACVQLASLLLDPEYSSETQRQLIAWMKSQDLESVNALGLLPFLRARLDQSDFTFPPFEEIASSVVKPSLLSALLLHEFSPDNVDLLPECMQHSGEVPSDFAVHPFFSKYVKTFLPPYFDFLAGMIEEGEVIAFRRHWAFEWQQLVNKTGVKLTDRNLYFWFGSHSEKERVLGTDTKVSEVYRSAFLRSLAWAVATDRLGVNDAIVFAVETCPVNLDLWRMKPVPKPDWFPRAREPEGRIDTVPAEVWRMVEDVWAGQQNGSDEWRIAETSGVVLDCKVVYDLEIYGMFQKSHGAKEPNLGLVAEWCHDELQLFSEMEHLHFRGWISEQNDRKWIRRFDDWSFAPASGSLNASSFARWQYWRMQRRVWLPAPYLASRRLDFHCNTNSIDVNENGEVIANWFDWVDGLTERHHIDLPMSTGQCLLVRREKIEEFAKSTGSSFCWVCRITGYHRKDNYESYKQVRDHREFGCTRIATG